MSGDFQRDRCGEKPHQGQLVGDDDGDVIAVGGGLRFDTHRGVVASGNRAVEQLFGTGLTISQGAVDQGGVACPGRGGIDHGVSGVNDDAELQEPGQQSHDQRHDHGGLCHGSAVVVS